MIITVESVESMVAQFLLYFNPSKIYILDENISKELLSY